jgi:ABC-type nickel/cobalt efflux system permease component RcnA
MTPWILELQKQFHDALTASLRAALAPDGGMALSLLLGFSFLYGVFHTLLPGHQKSVIGAYFLSENARYGQGFLAGALFAVFHAMTAIAVLLLIRLVLHFTAGQSLNQATAFTQTVSAWGIMGVAFVLFLMKVKDIGELRRRAALGRMRRRLGFDLHERLETAYEPVPWRRFIPFLFFAALLPCPGTLLVLLFSLSLGALGLGLASVAAITLGMAATLTALALTVIAAKQTGRGLTRKSKGWVGVFLLEMAGLVLLVGFAFLLIPFDGNNRVG